MQSRLLTIREQWILLGVAGAIVLGAAVLLWRGTAGTAAPIAVAPDGPVEPGRAAAMPAPETQGDRAAPSPATAPPPEKPEKIGVGVLGAVHEEGLYYFEPGARIRDLLDAAGGTLPEGDVSDINRTARLIDETTLLVPERIVENGERYSYPNPTYNPAPYTRSAWYRPDPAGSAAGSTGAGAKAAPGGGLVNINNASQAQLETLPGIGPVTAQKIIAYRNTQRFNAVGDLEEVSGIGPAKMAAVRDLITVD